MRSLSRVRAPHAAAAAGVAVFLLLADTPQAAIEVERFADPAAQERYAALVRDYTCATCSNASLADTRSPAARNYRQEIRRMVGDGKSDQEIRQYLEQRFAGQVLPRRGTGPLWALAVGAIAVAIGAFARALRRGLEPAAPTQGESST